MSTLTSTDWKSHSSTTKAMAHTQPFPNSSDASKMDGKLAAFRDTLIVFAVQLVFRASMAMRRWNY